MCGIIGIVGSSEVAASLYDGLTVLQHRGQDAAGIATANGTQLRVHKGNGLVRDVFDARAMALLEGRVGIGHCRYPTAGSEGSDEAQPFYVNSPYGITLAHNGNLINTDELRRQVFETDRRNVNTESDSEVLLNVFAHELDMQKALTPDSVFRAIDGVNRRARGGYAVVATVLGLGLVAFRVRTASARCARRRVTDAGTEYAVVGIGRARHPRLRAPARRGGRRGHRGHRARRTAHRACAEPVMPRRASSNTSTSRARIR